MYLVDVIPIVRGIPKETLSYFSSKEGEIGSIIFVPFRKKEVPALVVKNEQIKNVKARIKTNQFAIRKAIPQKSTSFLPQEFIQTAREIGESTASTTGAVLHAMIPYSVFEDLVNFEKKQKSRKGLPYDKKDRRLVVKDIFQANALERFSYYREMIRESFAYSSSVFIVVPTITDTEKVEKELSQGIDDYVFSFHSGLPKKELVAKWERVRKESHPVVIIGTPSFLSLFREDILTIIVESENNRAYKLPRRPHIDLRTFIEKYAEKMNVRLVFSDFPLQMETLWRYKIGELGSLITPRTRFEIQSKTAIIDMREDAKAPGKRFSVLSDMLKESLVSSIRNKEHYFLFSARRGIAPITVCRDCESVVTSINGNTPMILKKTGKGNAFISYRTGEIRSARERCSNCKSWRLEALGIGIERVYDAVYESFPDTPIFQIDRDVTNTHKKVEKVMGAFYKTPASILIGTELALPYFKDPIGNSAVVSLDTLLSLPEWRVTERIFSILLKMQAHTTKSFLLQTRKPEEKVLHYALSGDIEAFYKDEIKLRKDFSYPPFSVLIKISVSASPQQIEKAMELLKEKITGREIHIYPTSIYVKRGQETKHALIRIQKKEWPDERLLKQLKALPPYFSIDINPENLL